MRCGSSCTRRRCASNGCSTSLNTSTTSPGGRGREQRGWQACCSAPPPCTCHRLTRIHYIYAYGRCCQGHRNDAAVVGQRHVQRHRPSLRRLQLRLPVTPINKSIGGWRRPRRPNCYICRKSARCAAHGVSQQQLGSAAQHLQAAEPKAVRNGDKQAAAAPPGPSAARTAQPWLPVWHAAPCSAAAPRPRCRKRPTRRTQKFEGREG
jgi:hypothetical protein